jgi:acyl-coenzyme A synthetase/AMP-(fatty) acid ligase
MKKPIDNVAFDAVNHLAKNLNTTVFELGDHTVDGRLFRDLVLNCALHMKDRGVNKSSCVALLFNDVILSTAFTLAICLIGCRWINLTLELSKNLTVDITHIIHHSDFDIQSDVPIYKWGKDWQEKPKNTDLKFDPNRSPNDIWMIAQSSGTTGNAKNINVSYKNYWHRANDNNARLLKGVKKACCLYAPLKSSTQYRLITFILKNIPIVENLKYENLSKYDGLLITGSLGQIMHFIKDKHTDTPFDVIVDITGAASSKSDVEKLLKHFKTVRLCYGATETTRTCMKVITHIDQYNGSVGKPFKDVKIKINDDVIYIKCPRNVTDDWFVSGDLGYMKDNELYITGRKNEQINIGGVKIDPNTIDLFIKSIEGVEDCLVFQNTNLEIAEQLSVLIVGNPIDIFQPCIENVGISRTPKNVYLVKELPRNRNGKAVRKDAIKLIENIIPIKYYS